jgi:hypothetical protein
VTVGVGEKVLLLSTFDSESGQPVEHPGVGWSSDCPPQTTGTHVWGRVLILPNIDYTLVVSAPGYKKWHYTTGTGRIRLEPGQEMKLDVPLQREQQKPTLPPDWILLLRAQPITPVLAPQTDK